MPKSLNEYREEKYLSTREFATLLGITVRTLWRITKGDTKQTRPATMRKIADALGVSPGDITEFARTPKDIPN